MSNYNISTNNRFTLLVESDNDENESPPSPPQEQKKTKKETNARPGLKSKNDSGQEPKNDKKDSGAPKERKDFDNKSNKDKRPPRQSFEKKPPFEKKGGFDHPATDSPVELINVDPESFDQKTRINNRGNRGGFPRSRGANNFGGSRFEGGGGPRGGGFGRGGKRDFDRHSGSDKTGVKAVEKKENASGGKMRDVDDQVETKNAAQPEIEDNAFQKENIAVWNEDAEQEPTDEAKVEDAPPPQPQTMTLAEYQLQKDNMKIEVEYEVRKAGEGEDEKLWKNAKKIEKEDLDADEYVETYVKGGSGRPKKLINVDFSFNDRRFGGGGGRGPGRGGNRGFRGRGGRGGGPRPKDNSTAFAVNDNDFDFPVLST